MNFLSLLQRKVSANENKRQSGSKSIPSRIAQPLPQIAVETQLNHMKCFTSPNPDVKATVYNAANVAVGRVTYAVSPLNDRLYIFDITVFENYRRKGYGLAIVDWLHREHLVPMTTIKEVYAASSFWTQARHIIFQDGSELTTISAGDMPNEASRWAHLKENSEKLERQINERFSRGESYESAVGRGLDH